MIADALQRLRELKRHRGDLIPAGSYEWITVKSEHEAEWILTSDLDAVLATVREEKPEPRCPNCEHATPHTSGDEWDDRLTNQTRNVR